MDIKKAYFMATNFTVGNYSKLIQGKNKPNAEQSIVDFFKYLVLDKMYQSLDSHSSKSDLIDCLIYTLCMAINESENITIKDFFDFLDENKKPANNQLDDFLYAVCPDHELFNLFNKKFGISEKTLTRPFDVELLANKEIFTILNSFANYLSSSNKKLGSQLKDILGYLVNSKDALATFKIYFKKNAPANYKLHEYIAAALLSMPDEILNEYEDIERKYFEKIKKYGNVGKLTKTDEDVAKLLKVNTSKKNDKIEELKQFKEKTKGIFNKIVGQKDQLNAIMHVLYNAQLGLNNPEGPRASMLLTGPTGVGKTETAFAISSSLFGKEPFVVDLAVYHGSHQLSTLIGSPPGYVGYSDKPAFLEYLKENAGKGGVLLFDEFDKANPQVLNIFMHMLDKGEVQSAKGECYSVRNFIVITTSNISEKVSKKIGFGTEEQSIKNAISSNAVGNIPPELIARFDLVLAYQNLSKEEKIELAKRKMESICDKIKSVNDFLNVSIKYDSKVLEDLALTVNDSMGIRELFRNINTLATQKLVDYIMENDEFTDLVIHIKSMNDIVVKTKTQKKTKPQNTSNTSKKLKTMEEGKQ